MKLKIPRGTKPTVTIDDIQTIQITEKGRIKVLIGGILSAEEMEAFVDLGIIVTNDDGRHYGRGWR